VQAVKKLQKLALLITPANKCNKAAKSSC